MNHAEKRISWTHEGIDYFAEILCTDIVEITSQGKDLQQRGSAKPKEKQKKTRTTKKKKEECGGCGKNGVHETINDRKNICESCEHYDFGVCNECGCFCSAKVKLKSEKCPVGRW